MSKRKQVVSVIMFMLVMVVTTAPVPALSEAAHESGGGYHFNLLNFLGKFLNSFILFGGLILLLRKPLIELLSRKTQDIKNDILQREEELKKSFVERESLRHRLDRIEKEVENIKKQAEKDGNEEKKRIEELGVQEARRILELTDAEIELRVEKSIRNLKAKIADLTIDTFKKEIQAQLDDRAHKKIIDKNIERCGALIERK